jgi:DNA transposition AAA+ family ATPase
MNDAAEPRFVETKEYRRFVEFCDACRQYRYIGLCYGAPGVGKTLSARRYSHRDKDYSTVRSSNRALAKTFLKFDTILYTPPILASPGVIEKDIRHESNFFHNVLFERIRSENNLRVEAARQHMQKVKDAHIARKNPSGILWYEPSLDIVRAEKAFNAALKRSSKSLEGIPNPTPALVVVDEADRLKMAGLEQVRDIFDRRGVGVVLIGMPGIEKRLSRYPQLYSRVGFVHEFRPLADDDTRDLLRKQRWHPADISLPAAGLDDDAAFAAVLRITGGNFRLLNRLLTQIARIMDINNLDGITVPVVEAARESLVIGTA